MLKSAFIYIGLVSWLVAYPAARLVGAEPIRVQIERLGDGWRLVRGGQPYQIRGAGGDGSWEALAKMGGNSVRTWSADRLAEQLPRAQELGLTVTAGIWLGQVRQGFHWGDANSLIRQRQQVSETVSKYREEPALLVWALGNEVEDATGENGAVWSELNNLARLVKVLDPNHPTMIVLAEMGGDKIRNLHALCPDVDLVGINSYAGAATVGKRYRELGGSKPYVLTEFGPPGIWESRRDDTGAYRELSSTAKVEWYRRAYDANVREQASQCLGSYAFLWGQKQEVTATWFSMLLPDGSRLGPADALTEAWTGRAPPNRCPTIESLRIRSIPGSEESALVKGGENVELALQATDQEGDPLRVTWALVADDESYGTGGDAEAAGEVLTQAVVESDSRRARVRLPADGGLYRVFATVRDGQGGAAVANVPIRVPGPVRIPPAKKGSLPLVIYDEEGTPGPYAPSGWMGDAQSIRLDVGHRIQPKSGETALRCAFVGTTGWGGVVWQHPDQDWGDRRGGFDLTGAKKLVFDARGEVGNEEVSFSFGLIGSEKRFHDTAKGSLDKVRLSREWRHYEILIDGADLSRIKTPFAWTIASPGSPVVFYLDNVRWE